MIHSYATDLLTGLQRNHALQFSLLTLASFIMKLKHTVAVARSFKKFSHVNRLPEVKIKVGIQWKFQGNCSDGLPWVAELMDCCVGYSEVGLH